MSKATPRGAMTRRISIQSIDKTPTSTGQTSDLPVTLVSVWAKIEPLDGRELYLAKAQQDSTTHLITMPYYPGITAKMQAVWSGRTFNFTSVVNVEEADRELKIRAEEVFA